MITAVSQIYEANVSENIKEEYKMFSDVNYVADLVLDVDEEESY